MNKNELLNMASKIKAGLQFYFLYSYLIYKDFLMINIQDYQKDYIISNL